MHLESITINRVRGLGTKQPLRLDFASQGAELPRWVVVVGPNGSGKSTLLRSIALGLAGADTCRTLLPSVSWWLALGASAAQVSVVLRYALEDRWVLPPDAEDSGAEDTLAGSSSEDGADRPRLDPSAPREGSLSLSVEVLSGQGTRATFGLGGIPQRGPWSQVNRRPGWFVAGYGPYRRLSRASRQGDEFTDSEVRPIAQLASLFREDVALAEPLAWLKQLQLEVTEDQDAAARLKPAILALLSDGLLSGPGGGKAQAVDITSKGLMLREHGLDLPLTALSDGYQTVVGLVLDLVRHLHRSFNGLKLELDPETGRPEVLNEGVVLIDEIESHLHPSWQRTFGEWLTGHFPNVQFIVATHSPFICQEAASNGAIIRLTRPDEREQPRLLTADDLIPLLDGTADDIYLSGLFGIDSTRSAEAEARLDEAARLEALILSEEATPDEEEAYRQLKRHIAPSADVVQALRALGLGG